MFGIWKREEPPAGGSVSLFGVNISLPRGKDMVFAHRVDLHQHVDKVGGGNAIDLVQIVMNGDEQIGTHSLGQRDRFDGVKIADDVHRCAEIVTAVDGQDRDVYLGQPCDQTVVHTHVSRVEDAGCVAVDEIA